MPRTFATVRELIYWEYAKLISERAVGDRMNYKFANFTFRKMMEGKVTPSSILAENQQLFMLAEIGVRFQLFSAMRARDALKNAFSSVLHRPSFSCRGIPVGWA